MGQIGRPTGANIIHATPADTLPDVLERLLDKGIVLAGDIRIKLLDVELLTIHIRLLIASVDKAKEMGINWWEGNPFLNSLARERQEERLLADKETEIERLRRRVQELEASQP